MACHKGGPSRPNFTKVMDCAGKSTSQVADALGLDELAMHNVVHNRVPAIERWAPVFAKCALTARRGIAALLRKESPAATFKPASPSPEAVATPTVGETLFAALRVRGEKATQQLRDALVHGWAGWEQWHLSSKQVDDLFAGKCEEAEEVADFLLSFGRATDEGNLFFLFTV